jgi:hypothetical protein
MRLHVLLCRQRRRLKPKCLNPSMCACSQGRATIAAIVAGGRGRPAARRVTLAAIIISAPPVACHRSSFGSHGPSPSQSIVSVAQCIHAVRLSGFAYGCSFPSCLFRLCECVVKSRYADF